MATITKLTEGYVSGSSANTATISPTTNTLIAVVVGVQFNQFPSSLTVSGCNLSWSTLTAVSYSSRRRMAMIVGTGTPTSGQLTITKNSYAQDGLVWQIYEVSDVAVGSWPGWSNGSSSGTSASITISGSPGANDLTFAAVAFETDNNPTWEAGWTELADQSVFAVRRVSSAWIDGQDSTPSVTMSSTEWAMVAAFIPISGGGGGTNYDVATSISSTLTTSNSASASYGASIALGQQQGIDNSKQADMSAVASMLKAAQINSAPQIDYNVISSIISGVAIATNSQLSTGAQSQLAGQYFISNAIEANMLAVAGISKYLSIDGSAGMNISELLTIARMASVDLTSEAQLNTVVTITSNLLLSAIGYQSATASNQLQSTFIDEYVREAIVNGTASFDIVEQLISECQLTTEDAIQVTVQMSIANSATASIVAQIITVATSIIAEDAQLSTEQTLNVARAAMIAMGAQGDYEDLLQEGIISSLETDAAADYNAYAVTEILTSTLVDAGISAEAALPVALSLLLDSDALAVSESQLTLAQLFEFLVHTDQDDVVFVELVKSLSSVQAASAVAVALAYIAQGNDYGSMATAQAQANYAESRIAQLLASTGLGADVGVELAKSLSADASGIGVATAVLALAQILNEANEATAAINAESILIRAQQLASTTGSSYAEALTLTIVQDLLESAEIQSESALQLARVLSYELTAEAALYAILSLSSQMSQAQTTGEALLVTATLLSSMGISQSSSLVAMLTVEIAKWLATETAGLASSQSDAFLGTSYQTTVAGAARLLASVGINIYHIISPDGAVVGLIVTPSGRVIMVDPQRGVYNMETWRRRTSIRPHNREKWR